MKTKNSIDLFLSIRLLFCAFVFVGCLLASTADARAGFLYTVNQQDGSPNQIYGFSVNESNGALTSLGAPVLSGNGTTINPCECITIDRANRRLYVVNDGTNTISAFSINPANGALTPLPFSPIALPVGLWVSVAVHPSGSPLIAGDGDSSPVVASFNITATTAAAATGSPFSTGLPRPFPAIEFSRDANFVYTGDSTTSGNFAGFSVNAATGVLTPLPGSPFSSGGSLALALATDSQGRLFMTNFNVAHSRVFTTTSGIPTAVNGNPFISGLSQAVSGALHPNEKFYYVSDQDVDSVGAYQVSGSGAATTLAAVGSPLNTGGIRTQTVVFNGSGAFLFAANAVSRNITTYGVNASTGALTFGNVQPANTLGTAGNASGMAYLPTSIVVNIFIDGDDENPGNGICETAPGNGRCSLRAAVQEANALGGGVITFSSIFNVPRTISLDAGQISINSNITIAGTGANLLTVRNMAAASITSRVFFINGGAVNLSGMTITGGNLDSGGGGGGIINSSNGIATLSNCVVSGNFVSGSGGGIRNSGILNIINSTISGNFLNSSFVGPTGGGIFSSNILNITNSTISGNSASTSTPNVGGIFTSGTTTITNSTITNNSTTSGAGGVIAFGTEGTVTVRNTIIAGNQNNTTVPDVAGSFVSNGFNLIGNVGTATGFNQTGDRTGTGASPLNPRLVPVLTLRGGTTPTHNLLEGSPAIDKGNSFNLSSDQRCFLRPFDFGFVTNAADGSDIGAFEKGVNSSILTAPFDFDGDNKTDIAIFRPSLGEWWINRSSNGQTFALQFGAPTDVITPGDFTGDGKTDIAVWRPSNGFWFVLRSEDFSFFAFPFGLNGDIPAPADFDEDAIADVAVFRPSETNWYIRLSSTGGVGVAQFGVNGDVPVPADYDGDAKADVAIYRPSLGQWWIQGRTGTIAFQFGAPSDKPVQGDYTGDGKTDVAIFRPSTGEWFVLRSEDFSFFSFPFGTSGDITAPGDYDGDGKHDAAVFRPSNSTWFVQRTTAGTLIQGFGQSGDRPVPNAFVP